MTPVVWDKVVEFMEWKLVDFDFQEDDILFDWHVTANMLKLERELYELYGKLSYSSLTESKRHLNLYFYYAGPFKDIILHPIVQYLLELWNRYIDLNVTLGEPLVPLTTAVVILFMVHLFLTRAVFILSNPLLSNFRCTNE